MLAAHPAGRERDRVDELGVRVERDVHLVPEAGLGGDGLAAAAPDGAGGVDLVGREAEDHDLARELGSVVGQCEGGGDDGAGDHAMTAGVDGLDGAIGADRRDSVVQADEADGTAGLRALDGGGEGRIHAADASRDVEALGRELVGEELRALELAVPELRVAVDELDRGARVGLVGGYGGEDVCVGDHRREGSGFAARGAGDRAGRLGYPGTRLPT